MVESPKYKSNFVRGLEEDNNRILTYVTIFFTFIFLGLLLTFWIFEHRSSRCVFGPSCCYTELVNSSDVNALSSVNLLQRNSPDSWGAGPNTDPEIIIFDASSKENQGKNTFHAHLYKGEKIAGGTSFPNVPSSNSGFCIGAEGVSLYFDYYLTGDKWDNAYQLFYEGVNSYITTGDFIGKNYSEIQDNEKTIIYLTNATTNDGSNQVTTSLTPKQSFFTNFTPSKANGTGVINIKKSNSEGSTYNPFNDFLHTKNIVNTSSTIRQPVCIEPSSKNLPSCRSPYNSAQGGYAIINNNGEVTNYSKNCSHASFPGQPPDGKPAYIEQLVAKNTNVATNLQRCQTGGLGSDTDSCNCSLTGCDPKIEGNKGGVTLQVGKKSFSDIPGITSYTNPYLSTNIFCGKKTATGVTSMYPINLDLNASAIKTGVQGSSVPNATVKNGVYQLGFS